MGVLLLVFVPCLYSTSPTPGASPASGSGSLVSAAGMLVELVLASVATIVWWYAQPGLVRMMALDIMVVSTVNTLAINGNPLLRYDGYYILSDLVESPNLWQRSREALQSLAGRWLLGNDWRKTRWCPTRHRGWLAGYALASKTYYACMFAAIVWGLVRILHPHHLENLAYAVGLTLIGGALVGPAGSRATNSSAIRSAAASSARAGWPWWRRSPWRRQSSSWPGR